MRGSVSGVYITPGFLRIECPGVLWPAGAVSVLSRGLMNLTENKGWLGPRSSAQETLFSDWLARRHEPGLTTSEPPKDAGLLELLLVLLVAEERDGRPSERLGDDGLNADLSFDNKDGVEDAWGCGDTWPSWPAFDLLQKP